MAKIRRAKRPPNGATPRWPNWRSVSWPSISSQAQDRDGEFYRDILDRLVKPEVGTTKADKVTRLQVGRLHSSQAATPFQANRMLAVVGSMYAFAALSGMYRKAPIRHARSTSSSKIAASVSDRRRIRTAGRCDPRGRDHRHPMDGGRNLAQSQARAQSQRSTRIAPFAAAALRLFSSPVVACGKSSTSGGEHVDFERGSLSC